MDNLKSTKVRIETNNPTKNMIFSMKKFNTDKILKTKLLLKNLSVFFQRNTKFYKDMFYIYNQRNIKSLQLADLLLEKKSAESVSYSKIIIFICSNKGLCNKYNDDIYNTIRDIIENNQNKNFILFPIGNKGSIFTKSLQQKNLKIYDLGLQIEINDLNIDEISIFINVLWDIIIQNNNVELDLIYTHTSLNKKKKILIKNLFPIIKQIDLEDFIEKYDSEDYIIPKNIVTDTLENEDTLVVLFKDYLQASLYKCILYALYSEYVNRADAIENLYNKIAIKTSNLYRDYNKLQHKLQANNVLEAISIYKKI